MIVRVRARCACGEPRAACTEKVLPRFRPCLGLTTAVSLPRSVTRAACSQRTTKDSVPLLPRVLLWCALSAGGTSTLALLARIVHDGLGVAMTIAVGAEVAVGAAVLTATVPATTFPTSSPIRQKGLDEHARPVTAL